MGERDSILLRNSESVLGGGEKAFGNWSKSIKKNGGAQKSLSETSGENKRFK